MKAKLRCYFIEAPSLHLAWIYRNYWPAQTWQQRLFVEMTTARSSLVRIETYGPA
jgi:hypothetical protein